jgi:hypothetical protein
MDVHLMVGFYLYISTENYVAISIFFKVVKEYQIASVKKVTQYLHYAKAPEELLLPSSG